MKSICKISGLPYNECSMEEHMPRGCERVETETSGSEISTFVDKSMYEAAPMATHGINVSLISATPDPLGAIAAACRMYEGKPTYSLADITDDERRRAWEQVQATHLKAPLEFVDLHFFIEGVTRSFTHQMVRQRTAVYAQESMRFAVKRSTPDGDDEFPARSGPLISQDRGSKQLWDSAMRGAWTYYESLIANGMPAEEARGVLPHDTLTRLNYKTNLRNLLEHAGNRLCTQAQFEWRVVFIGIVQAIAAHSSTSQYELGPEGNNWQWEHIAGSSVFKPVCFSLGHCPFNADFDRGCTIRPRVEAGEFAEIKPEEYMSNPKAAWVS
jgi:flavin-dependent thymidylate synthase